MKKATEVLQRLADIATAYEKNELDDEARRFWGPDWSLIENTTPKDQIELYQGRGGKRLLTLQDCFDARDALEELRRPVYPRDALDM